MEYITKIFLEFFDRAIYNANMISRMDAIKKSDRGFFHDYRFIFCFRDENDAQINPHLAYRIGFKRISLNKWINSDLYVEILQKRLLLVNKIFSAEELANYGFDLQIFSNLFSKLIKSQYFSNVFLPLFNYDYRLSSGYLLQIIRKYNSALSKGCDYGNIGNINE